MGARRSGLWRRLPLLALLGVGALLWRSSLFPQERHLVWVFPTSGPPIHSVDVQLWKEGKIVRREERSFQSAPLGLWQWNLSLREGTYHAEVFTHREGEVTLEHVSRDVIIEGGDSPFAIPISAR